LETTTRLRAKRQTGCQRSYRRTVGVVTLPLESTACEDQPKGVDFARRTAGASRFTSMSNIDRKSAPRIVTEWLQV
jgi:hypothetical protein